MITHPNEIEREIYQLERELQTAVMNDRDWDIDSLKNEISELESELEKEYNYFQGGIKWKKNCKT